MKARAKDLGGHLADVLRAARQKRGVSQKQLALRLNIPRTYISKVENGKAVPILMSLDRLARGLNTTPSALILSAEKRRQKAQEEAAGGGTTKSVQEVPEVLTDEEAKRG